MLKRRLVDIYEYGNLSYLNALLAARSFSQFVERWEDLRLLIAANQRAVRARKAAEARVAAMQAALEQTRLATRSRRSRLSRKRAVSSVRLPTSVRISSNLPPSTGEA